MELKVPGTADEVDLWFNDKGEFCFNIIFEDEDGGNNWEVLNISGVFEKGGLTVRHEDEGVVLEVDEERSPFGNKELRGRGIKLTPEQHAEAQKRDEVALLFGPDEVNVDQISDQLLNEVLKKHGMALVTKENRERLLEMTPKEIYDELAKGGNDE